MRDFWKKTLFAGLCLASVALVWAADEGGVIQRFEKADKNGDGKITLAELTALTENAKRAQKLFDRFDKDGNGSVTKAELKAGAQAMMAAKAETMKKPDKNPAVKPEPEKSEPSKTDAIKSAAATDQRHSTRNPIAAAAAIDHEINLELTKAMVPASPVASDSEFIRRLSLDLRGRIPSVSETQAFLKDTGSDKRRKLIDEYLADEEYGEHFAIIWYHRIAKPDDDNMRALVKNELQPWLADGFNQNRGWDGIVKDILTATGDREHSPATTFWLSAVNDAKLGQPDPAKATAAASRLFMGVRLECCQCHNHPFTELKQTDFWGTAAFFAQTHAKGATQKAAKANATPDVFEQAGVGGKRKKKGETADKTPPAPFGSVAIPFEEGKTVHATFLGGKEPDVKGQSTLRPIFAEWLTASTNPYFARAAVNKLWANFFGRGIVDPIDDMQADSPNTHPRLLSFLADEFAASKYDQKHLIRCICNSHVYQRSSQPTPENKSDDVLYSKMPLKIMTADMLYDSLATALGHQVAEAERRGKGMAGKKQQGGPRQEFRKFFHAESDDDAGIVADYSHGVPQVLRLMNAKQINDTSTTVANLMQTETKPDKIIAGLYATVLSREPTPAEITQAKKFIATDKDAANAYGDLMWALLNTSEFLFNH
ncbi:MAG: hypothetical protein JWN70_5405 [Planctomycetaceae bacterium]|nr:hypothetical protein [Planctomycetaceae bacterium]